MLQADANADFWAGYNAGMFTLLPKFWKNVELGRREVALAFLATFLMGMAVGITLVRGSAGTWQVMWLAGMFTIVVAEPALRVMSQLRMGQRGKDHAN
jgi:hypothetical protein